MTIGKAEATEIARRECARRGLDFDEPISVTRGLRAYKVWTNARSRGGNVLLRVDRRTGEVEFEGVTPR